MRQAEKKTVVKTLTATNIEWGKLVSRAVLIGGGMVPPKDVNVAKGYSATEDLSNEKIYELDSRVKKIPI